MNSYENYPISILFITSVSTVLSYLIGAWIFYYAGGIILGLVYILLVLVMFALSMRFRCAYCYYYGKKCASGLGVLAKWFFRQRDNVDFSNPKNVTLVASLSFPLLFLPLIVGVILIFFKFSWNLILFVGLYFLIAVYSGFALRKNIICKKCKQGELGCPAYQGMMGTKKA